MTEEILQIDDPPNPIVDFAFFDEHGEVGCLTFSEGQIHFKGNADKSAKLFFDYFIQYTNDYIKEQLRR